MLMMIDDVDKTVRTKRHARASHKAARKRKQQKKEVFLTKFQFAELKRLHIPKGVDWQNIKLSRRQKALLRAARDRQARLLAQSLELTA